MKKIIVAVCMLTSLFLISQEKTKTDFFNTMTPVYPGCEAAEDKYNCYVTAIGTLILPEINKENLIAPIASEKIQIRIGVRTEIDGKTSILQVENADEKIVQITKEALSKMPLVKPVYSETAKKKQVSSQRFFVTLNKNKTTGLFELYVPEKRKNDASEPAPDFEIIKHALFPGCETTEVKNYSDCFKMQFNLWLNQKIPDKIKGRFRGKTANLKLKIERDGKVTPTILSESDELKRQLELILKALPEIKPAESNTEKIGVVYSIPVYF